MVTTPKKKKSATSATSATTKRKSAPAKAAAPDSKPRKQASTGARAPSTRASKPTTRSTRAAADAPRNKINPATPPKSDLPFADSLSKIVDSFAFKKLEDVFDNRVAASMERIGYPSAQEIRELMEQVAQLSKRIQSMNKKAAR